MYKRHIIFLPLLLASCALKVEDVRIEARADTSAGANFLISRSAASGVSEEEAEAGAKRWARKVISCGGRQRQVFQVSGKEMIETSFDVRNRREKDLLLLCLAQQENQADASLTRRAGLFSDTYVLKLRFIQPFKVFGGDLLPEKLNVEMPGRIVAYKDRSSLPIHEVRWAEEGDNALTMRLRDLTKDELAIRHAAFARRPPTEAEARKLLDSTIDFEVTSQVEKWSVTELVTLLGGIAALLPILFVLIRRARRIWSRRTAPEAPKPASAEDAGKSP